MSTLDLYRYAVSVLAMVAFAVNLSLIFGVIRHRAQNIAPGVWIAYAAASAATVTVSLYFRLRDQGADLSVNVGDFTALVPIVGFLTAGIMAWRHLGRTIGRNSVDI